MLGGSSGNSGKRSFYLYGSGLTGYMDFQSCTFVFLLGGGGHTIAHPYPNIDLSHHYHSDANGHIDAVGCAHRDANTGIKPYGHFYAYSNTYGYTCSARR